MPLYEIVRGDTYAIRRPFFRYELVTETNTPFDLAGCTVRTTSKVAPLSPQSDPTDTRGVLKGTLIVDHSGMATTEDHLYMIGPSADGVIEHRLSAADTVALPLGVTWITDVEVVDADGEVTTFFFDGDTITTRDGITNRTS